MSRRTKCKWFVVGLAVMAAMSTGGGLVYAGTVIVKGHQNPLPGGSPFLYTFELDLEQGTIAPGSSLQVGTPPKGIIGVDTNSGTGEPPKTGPNPNDFWSVPAGGIVTTGSGPYGTQSSVTWDFISGTTYTNTNPNKPVEVAIFTAETAFNYPDNMPPSIPGITVIDFTFHFADGSIDTGSFTLSIPEPSSVILLLAGVGAVPLLRGWVKRS
jgi:hypothetical protein